MAFIQYAVVKLDPPESKSNGGMVVDLVQILPESEGGSRLNCTQHWAKKVDEYKLIPISQNSNVRVGWIYTDKTNYFVAP